ncbi:MAG: S4 domain-containing protein, partial [Patescibacteria group bacterium]|nr:S4 domain-containing protein [Patescibacteria group bacterium]
MAEKSQKELNRIFSSGYKISDQSELCRLDRFLVNNFASSLLAGFSRTKIVELIRDGIVRVNNSEISKPSRCLNLGDLVHIDAKRLDDFSTSLQKLKSAKNFTSTGDEKVVVPEDLPLDIVYEDDEMMFIDKEAGMVVHPAAGHSSGTLANALAWHFQD